MPSRFLTAFVMPYLLEAPYANLGSKVGFIFGSTAICATIFAYFCVPECRGKTLEEVDQLFLDRVPIRQFGKTAAAIPDVHDTLSVQGKVDAVNVVESERV